MYYKKSANYITCMNYVLSLCLYCKKSASYIMYELSITKKCVEFMFKT